MGKNIEELKMTKIIHYTRTGYNGDLTYDSICGKKIKSIDISISPENTTCPKCLAHADHKIDLNDQLGKGDISIKRRIFIESDILQGHELRRAQRAVSGFAKDKNLKCVDRVFSEILDYAWHDLEKTWSAVKKADEIYADSSLMPLSGGSYMGAPVIFNGMCERAVKEGLIGKSVIILNTLDNIYWDMIDLKLMKQAFKKNDLYMYDETHENIVKIDVSKIKK